MPFYRVKDGHQCGHNGKTLEAGTVIDVSEHIGREVAHLLEPCTKNGQSLAGLSPDELAVVQAKQRGLGPPAAETTASTVVKGAKPLSAE